MKKAGKRRIFGLAVCLAMTMHLLLFIAIRPASGDGLTGALVPPRTHYLARSSGPVSTKGSDVRTVWSPILFSLPSELGFSRELLREKLSTRLTFRQPSETESFLSIDPALRNVGTGTPLRKLMITSGGDAASRTLPTPAFQLPGTRPAPSRVYVTPELKERLVGGIVLPPELNKTGDEAWGIRADIIVSGEGGVQHVFLERPLEAVPLNQAIIRLLHGLRFKPDGRPVEGRIEIYSPTPSSGEGASQ